MLQDIANFISISRYCNAEFSKKIFPNAIFLFFKAIDNRYNSEKSKFVLSLKQIKKLNIVCREHPNVVIIINWVCALSYKNIEKWKNELSNLSTKVQSLVNKHLGVVSPVILLENEYIDYELKISDDKRSSFLPDGTIQPANLYLAIVDQARKNNDKLLENAMHHLFSNSLIRKATVNIRTSIIAKVSNLEKLNEEEKQIAMEMQKEGGRYFADMNFIPPQAYMIVGAGFNIISDELKPTRVFEIDINDTYNMSGIQLPKGFEIAFVNQSQKFSEFCENQNEYIQKRLASLHLGADFDLSIFKMKTRAGFSDSSNLSKEKNSINHTLLQEVRLFKIEIREKTALKLTKEFIDSVKLLPSSYCKDDSINKNSFQSFFNEWGHFIVSSAYGGGSVEICHITESSKHFKESVVNSQFILEISFNTLSGCGSKFSNSETEKIDFSKLSLKWNGGDSKFHVLSWQESNLLSKWSSWRESLKTKPSMLTTEMSLTYIYEYVGLADQTKMLGCNNALDDLLGVSKFNHPKDLVTNRQKIVEIEKAKSDDGNCFPGKALVYIKDHESPTAMSKLKIMDEVLSFDTNLQQLVYSPVFMFGHKDGSIVTTFIYIQTSNGLSVTLSAKHMIMVETKTKIEVKFADQVRFGDTLLQIKKKDNKMKIVKEQVTQISTVNSEGIYSPFTKTGTIIVDGTLASCYAHVSNFEGFGLFRISGQTLAHSFLTPFRALYNIGITGPIEISIGQTMPITIKVAAEKFNKFLEK